MVLYDWLASQYCSVIGGSKSMLEVHRMLSASIY